MGKIGDTPGGGVAVFVPQQMSEDELFKKSLLMLTARLSSGVYELCSLYLYHLCHANGFPADHHLKTLTQITNKYLQYMYVTTN